MEQYPMALDLYVLILPFVCDKTFRQRISLTEKWENAEIKENSSGKLNNNSLVIGIVKDI